MCFFIGLGKRGETDKVKASEGKMLRFQKQEMNMKQTEQIQNQRS